MRYCKRLLLPAGQLVEVELEEPTCEMPALPSVFDYLTVDVTLWAQTLWRFARDVVREPPPVPLRIAFSGVAGVMLSTFVSKP